jgi:hypothetical protein
MDIQLTSFILGIVSVLVIAVSVVSVYAIVKLVKLKNEFNSHMMWDVQENERLKNDLNNRELSLIQQIRDTNKLIDSRCDKLYEKIMKNRHPLKEMIGTAEENGFRSGILQILNKEEEGNGLKDRILELINKTT